MRLVRITSLFSIIFFCVGAFANTGNFTYQGQIVKPNGFALESNSVTFTVEVVSPAPSSCILYRERHSRNMTGSNGIFSLEVGDGTRTGSGDYSDNPINTLANAVNNSAGTLNSLTCAVGNSYTPASGDVRQLRVMFNDGSGPNVVAQNHTIHSVPFAQSANTIDGITSDQLLLERTDAGNELSQANLENIFTTANHAELLSLLNGTSSTYLASTPSADFDMNTNKIINVDDPVNAGDAANKNYVDSNIGGSVANASLATLAAGQAGQVLTWDGAQWTVTTPSTNDTTKLPLAGGTMTGAINMNSQDLTGANDITSATVTTTGAVGAGTTLSSGTTLTVGTDASVGGNATITGNTGIGGNANIGGDANVTGNVVVTGGIGVATGINSDGAISLHNEEALQFGSGAFGATSYVGFKAPAGLITDTIWTLPATDGIAGEVLVTDGSGVLSWVDPTSLGSVSSVFGRTGAVVANAGDYTASEVTNVAAGNIAAVTVQGAIDELDSEKVATTRSVITGSGLTGGGDLSADRTLSVDIAGTTLLGAAVDNADTVLIYDSSGTVLRQATRAELVLSEAEVDAYVSDNGYALQTDMDAVEADVATLQTDVGTLQTDVGTLQTDVGTLQTDMTAAQADITALETDMTTAQGDITTLQSDVTALDSAKVNRAGDSMTGALQLSAQNELRFADSDSSNYVGFTAPAVVAGNIVWELPAVDGAAGEVLSTDGSGVLSWVDPASVGAVSSVFGRSGAVVATAGDYTASEVTNVAAGNIAAVTVQAAIDELDSEKVDGGRSVTAGAGLTGGGDLTSDRTFDVGAGAGIAVAADSVSVDIAGTTLLGAAVDNADTVLVYDSSGTVLRQATRAELVLSEAEVDAYVSDNGYALQTDMDAAEADIATLQTDVGTLQTDVGTLQTDMTAAQADITALQSDMTTAQADITALETDMATAQSDITTLQSDVTALDSAKVERAGDSMTGALQLNAQNELRLADSDSSNYVGLRSPATVGTNYTFTLPDTPGTSGQVLETDGTGVMTWRTLSAVGETNTASNQGSAGVGVFDNKNGVDLEFRNVVAGSTKIGVTLDAGNKNIEIDVNEANLDAGVIPNTAAGNIAATNVQAAIDELDTEKVAKAGDTMTGSLMIGATNEIRLGDADSSNYVGFVSPSVVAGNIVWELPAADGTAGQVLTTDGSGALSWEDATAAAPVDSVFGRTGVVVATAGDYTAAQVTNVAAGNIAATTVQAAIDELDTEKVGTARTITAGAGLTGGGDLSADRTLDIGAGTGIAVAADAISVDIASVANKAGAAVAADSLLIVDSEDTNSLKEITRANFLSGYLAASIGTSAGDVMGADAVPDCLASEKLQMSAGPVYTWSCVADVGVTDHGGLTGLTDDDHTQYALLAGRSGGQSVIGGTDSGDDLTLESTSDATKGDLLLQPNSGNVGIGTAAPVTILDVQKSSSSSAANSYPMARVLNTNATQGDGTATFNFAAHRSSAGNSSVMGDILAAYNSGGSYTDGVYLRSVTNHSLHLQTNSNTRMTINTTGNVGVGTTSPGTLLDVAGAITSRPLGTATGETGQIILRELAASGTNTVTIKAPDALASDLIWTLPTSNGSGGQLLSTDGSGNLSWVSASAATTVSATSGSAAAPSMSFSGDTDSGLYSSAANTIGVSTGGANVFNISSAGLVSPTAGGGLVTTAAGSAAAPTFSFSGDADTGWFSPAANTLAASTGGAERMRIDSSGYIGIRTTGPASPLDIRLPTTSTSALADKNVNLGVNVVPISGRSGVIVQASNSYLTTDDNAAFGYLHPFDASNGSAAYKVFRIMTGTESGTTDNAATTITDRYFVRKDGGAYFGGNVGIGTATADTQLHLMRSAGNSRLKIENTGNGNSSQLQFSRERNDGTDYVGGAIGVVSNTASPYTQMFLNARSASAEQGVNGTGTQTPFLTLGNGTDNNTAVGVGTISPSSPLDVVGAMTSRPFGTATGETGQIKLRELAASGTNTVTLKAPDALASDLVWTLPTTNGSSGNVLTTNGSGTLSWAAPAAATAVSASAGTAAAPSMSFSGDTNTGLYSSAADTIGISTGGTNRFDVSSAGLVSTTTGGGLMTTAAGTAAAPTFSFAGDSDTGWFRPAANALAASTGGTERMRITSAGRLGLGTDNPGDILHVNLSGDDGGIYIGNNPPGDLSLSAGASSIFVIGGQDTAGEDAGFFFRNEQTNVDWGIYNDVSDADKLKFQKESNAPTMVFDGSNVGIGTAAPTYVLDVNSGTNSSAQRIVASDGTVTSTMTLRHTGINVTRAVTNGAAVAQFVSADTLDGRAVLQVQGNSGATDVLWAGANGNVGIGTTAPDEVLHTSGALRIDGAKTGGATQGLVLSDETGYKSIQSYNSEPLVFNSLGNYVGIGGNNPQDMLQVEGTLPIIRLHDTNTGSYTRLSANSGTGSFAISVDDGNTTANSNIDFKIDGSDKMTILSSGNVGIGTTTPSSTLNVHKDTGGAGISVSIDGTGTNDSATLQFFTKSSGATGLNNAATKGWHWYARSDGYTTTPTQANDLGLNFYNGTSTQNLIYFDSAAGNVGIGTSSPRAKLDVSGSIASAPAVADATGTVDYSGSNLAYTSSSCGAFNLHNMKNGATYTLAIQGTSAATCSFTAYSDAGSTALTVRMPPDHGATTASNETLYSFVVIGTRVYVAWIPGY